MSPRSDKSKTLLSVLAICMLLAGGAVIASTDAAAQRPKHPPRGDTKASQVQQPKDPLTKARMKTIRNACGAGWHKGADGKCYIN